MRNFLTYLGVGVLIWYGFFTFFGIPMADGTMYGGWLWKAILWASGVI